MTTKVSVTTLTSAIRQYIALADAMLLQGIRLGALSIQTAKDDAAEIEKWRERLAKIEADATATLDAAEDWRTAEENA